MFRFFQQILLAPTLFSHVDKEQPPPKSRQVTMSKATISWLPNFESAATEIF
jgi:hypothetical protein